MSDILKPNTQQANAGNMGGITNEFLANWLRNEVDGMVPARVVSYDDDTNRATLHPIVMMGGTDGSKVKRADVQNIPVYRFGGGGFFMRFPLKVGDLGWLAANDNDISLIMQGGGVEDWPNTTRQCKFSDAMFFPDTLKAWVIDGANADNAVWQTVDGETCIALGVNGVKISKGDVSFELTAAGIAMISPPGTLTHNGKNVGDTHKHTGPATAPLGPVSPTGVPI
jgi:hypothetical protein